MATMPSAAQDDLVGVITKDHREIELILAQLQLGEGTPQHRRDLADHLTTELVRHAVAEEMYMYPAARRVLADGDDVADRAIAEHAEVEHILKDLEGVDATDRQFDDLVGRVIAEVRHHVVDEEQQVLIPLREACGAEGLQELGRMVVRAKESAPTRPHPSAPDKPPANLILGPGVGMIDRLRDALTGRDRC
ncbi:hemerythrin HHE cation binding domain-containing protein [Kribbella sp. VKM Ac-2527]|uniref:Hemerythrin HHE cation binding domain-containing protein n=1 Tax=Kribbella caucasensis TaxID=2512215 RepID=A0A4R6KBG7_9ACTN|nr:hemerythrin domain-containing protein [Kribbella sp. VKM Ac-2527]TDO46778.1 hemerythrin HHE cation binding domain-containing protein [Kribbella sp. VKM Ac-2527]